MRAECEVHGRDLRRRDAGRVGGQRGDAIWRLRAHARTHSRTLPAHTHQARHFRVELRVGQRRDEHDEHVGRQRRRRHPDPGTPVARRLAARLAHVRAAARATGSQVLVLLAADADELRQPSLARGRGLHPPEQLLLCRAVRAQAQAVPRRCRRRGQRVQH